MFKYWKRQFLEMLIECNDLYIRNLAILKKKRDLEIALKKSNDLTERLLKIIENGNK